MSIIACSQRTLFIPCLVPNIENSRVASASARMIYLECLACVHYFVATTSGRIIKAVEQAIRLFKITELLGFMKVTCFRRVTKL